jgi:hypothetical protein
MFDPFAFLFVATFVASAVFGLVLRLVASYQTFAGTGQVSGIN